MKKVLLLLMLITVFISLCSCGKSEAATNVDNMILEIGEVTLESEEKISAAEKAASELKESEYNQLEQLSTLEEARTIYERLVEEKRIADNKQAISEIETAINAIGVVTLEQESAITSARTLYDKGNDDVKAGITNYEVLEYAEAQLSNLKVQNVIDLIDQIGQVTLDSGEKIDTAKAAYDALASDEKVQVTNSANIETASTKLVELQTENRIENIIRVTKLQVSRPNSAGGVSLYIGFKNMSDKIIKYLTFEVVPYNAVGDIVYCDIRDYANFRGQATGPYAKGEGLAGNNSGYWDCAWYNYSITDVELESIYIQYMDGTSIVLSEDELDYVF